MKKVNVCPKYTVPRTLLFAQMATTIFQIFNPICYTFIPLALSLGIPQEQLENRVDGLGLGKLHTTFQLPKH